VPHVYGVFLFSLARQFFFATACFHLVPFPVCTSQHTVLHHSETNSLAHDKDMLDQPVLRFSPMRSRWLWNPLQVSKSWASVLWDA
jgi:hypothetical protein